MTPAQKPEAQAVAPIRAAFEAWMRSRYQDGDDLLWPDAHNPEQYAYGSAQAAWEAWQHMSATLDAAVASADREWFGKLQAADSEIARLTAALGDCGKDNCMGQTVKGVTQWCTLEARDAAVAEAVAKERELRQADAERLDWLATRLFTHRWNGVVGSGWAMEWGVAPDHRHTVHHMRDTESGDMTGNFRAAIDAAIRRT